MDKILPISDKIINFADSFISLGGRRVKEENYAKNSKIFIQYHTVVVLKYDFRGRGVRFREDPF